jgi:hypothetical protein
MKNAVKKSLGILLLASSVACMMFISCKKDKDTKSQGVLNITGINDNTSQVINVKMLKSMEKKTIPIGCHGFSTKTFDVINKSFGYMDCEGNYRMIDVETGVEIKQIPLPELIGLVVVDTVRNVIIGYYYDNKDDPNLSNNKWINHVLSINLSDGNIMSDKQFYVGGDWNSSVYFFRDIENEYVLMRHIRETNGNELLFINPPTGTINRTVELADIIGNGVYDRKNNRLIGSTYSNETGKHYIVTIDLNTGKTLNKVVAQDLGDHFAGEMDYDAETNSYILVNGKNEVLFF